MYYWASKVCSQHMFFSFNSYTFFAALSNFVHISCMKTLNHKIHFGGERRLGHLTFLSQKYFKIKSFGMFNCASKSTDNMVWWESTWACKFLSQIIWEWLGMKLTTSLAQSSFTTHTWLYRRYQEMWENGNISKFWVFKKTTLMKFSKDHL